jgi:hypothetical protein
MKIALSKLYLAMLRDSVATAVGGAYSSIGALMSHAGGTVIH